MRRWILCVLVVLTGCGGGVPAAPVHVDGTRARLVDGAGVDKVKATAGYRGDHQWVGHSTEKGRIELPVRRTGLERFSIGLPAEQDPSLRVLHVEISYRSGVLTPYQPANDWGNETDPKPFKHGVYAVRVRPGLGDCP